MSNLFNLFYIAVTTVHISLLNYIAEVCWRGKDVCVSVCVSIYCILGGKTNAGLPTYIHSISNSFMLMLMHTFIHFKLMFVYFHA